MAAGGGREDGCWNGVRRSRGGEEGVELMLQGGRAGGVSGRVQREGETDPMDSRDRRTQPDFKFGTKVEVYCVSVRKHFEMNSREEGRDSVVDAGIHGSLLR